jgi:hypothetical protein
MTTARDDDVQQLELMASLIDQSTDIAGEVVALGGGRWGIYGEVPLEGPVLVAEYDTPDAAHAALARLGPNVDLRPRAEGS